jgi:proline iminopeptidase
VYVRAMRAWFVLVLAACGGGGAARVNAPNLASGTQRIAVDKYEVVVDIRGSGPPCIAHPGGPGLDSGYLHIPALEKRFTMIYIDPLGTGASSKLPEGEQYSLPRDAQVIEGVRAKLELDKVCLVGHSYGGFVVQTYAIQHPQRVSAMMLYSTTPTTEPDWEKSVGENMQWFKDQAWFADASAAFQEEAKAKTDAELHAVAQREWPMYFADWTGHRSTYTPLVAQLEISADVYRRRPEGKNARYDVRRKLGTLRSIPTVIVAGDRDFICGPGPSEWISKEISGSKLIVIPNAGHFAHVEQPAAFDAAVDELAKIVR